MPSRMTRLAGGVSSDIWRVELPRRTVCVKRALAKLRVAQDWYAPVGRNRYEAAYMNVAGMIVPGAVPRLLAHDEAAGALVMEYLPEQQFFLWKLQLRDGVAEVSTAAAVGAHLAAIHAGTADRADIANQFPTDAIFHAIRLEPYLLAAARVHPALAPALEALVHRTAATKCALVHGDVSPKNILIGPAGPVLLDAECAWYGDPAFDLAFCLNHLLLKCLWTPSARAKFLSCFNELANSYWPRVNWEARAGLEARAAHLLPGLMLARVDGKSPVEYVSQERDKSVVRRVATMLLLHPVDQLAHVAAAWDKELKV
ncbi:MAG: aminoglycoside phosphotransferase family protein [Alphaproteobacteria bacterium]|nr:aminoglycoside phosphotransferase family protein [Alphaproteobacteria bacterium]